MVHWVLDVTQQVFRHSDAEKASVAQGKSGVTPIESFSCDDYSTRFAGEIKGFQCNGYVTKKNERRMDNCIKYTMVAGKKVMARMLIFLEFLRPL